VVNSPHYTSIYTNIHILKTNQLLGKLEEYAWSDLWRIFIPDEWIEAITRMYRLKNDMEFYLAGRPPEEIQSEKLEAFLDRYKEIWNILNENYIRHRKEDKKALQA